MTPKAQQISAYDAPVDLDSQYGKKDTSHERNPSSSSDIIVNIDSSSRSHAALILNNLSNRITSVINPAVIFLVATPIAVSYPTLQLIMFITILIGTSPLYFIMISLIGTSSKHSVHYKSGKQQQHHHRRQPSIVGSISELSSDHTFKVRWD